ncbi:MAG TPA: trypsin-like serine protease [Verrucomicrobiae bacterium]|nr:trypsin-like serine protease [Verrucomicrobiae bacterium]
MRWIKIRFLTTVEIFVLATFSSVAWSATIRDDVSDSDYVALGNDPAFAAVGTFTANLTGCGTLIAPDWVLTAAHLILGAHSGTFTLDGTAYSATQIITDPNWDGNPSDGNDFALVQLSSSLTPIPPSLLYTGSTLLGQTATFVGYGFTGTGLTGYRTLDGQKRGFQDVVDLNNSNFGNTVSVFGSTFDSPADNALSLEGCVAPGDSGGGVFVSDGSQYYLAGVISFVASTNGAAKSYYNNISGFDSISPAMPWITSTVPEPSTIALLATSAVAVIWRKRCRRPKTPRF